MIDSFFIVQKKKTDISFTITCHINNSDDLDFTINAIVGDKFSTLKYPSISKPGYYFDGWYFENDFSGQKVTKETYVNYFKTDIYAKWVSMEDNCTEFSITTTTSNQTVGIYSLTKRQNVDYIYIDWGDGTCQILDTNGSKIEHKYISVGNYSLKINDGLASFKLGNSDYYSNGAGIKQILSLGSNYVQPTSFSTYEFSGVGFSNLYSLDLFTSITSLPSYCFYRSAIESLEGMPSRITSMGSYCFQYSTSLRSLTGIGSGIKTIPSYCFQYSGITSIGTLHSGITSLQTYAFSYCQSLTDLTGLASGGFTSLPNYCFYYCSNLTSTVTLPSKITSLGQYCFAYCSRINNLSGITSSMSLGVYCFYYCSGLANLSTLPARTSLPNYCFQYCTGLTSISLGSTFTSLGQYCFGNCTALQTVDFSQSGLNSLPAYCFYNCYNIRSVTLKSKMNGSIGNYCFYNCYNSNFSTIEIPEGVTSLGSNCFRYCYSLKTVTLPSTCASLGTYCFAGCRQIKDLTCNRIAAPSTSTYTFGSSTGSGTNTYTGYTTRGSNTLWVKQGATGYDSGLWSSPLQNASYCGFTKKVSGGEEEDWGDGEREYLQSDGLAAINTGIQPILNSTKMVAEFCPGSCTGNVFFGMSQGQTGSDSTDFRFFTTTNSTGNTYWDYDGQRMEKTSSQSGIVSDLKTWYHIECSNGRFQVNDTVYTLTTATGSVGTGTIYIGQDANSASVTSIFKIRNFKVYEGNTLVGNFVPWVLNGTPCIYDTVTSAYFYNANGGSFTAGPPMTDGEKIWLKGTGTQYINTGHIVEQGESYELTAQAAPSLTASYAFFGYAYDQSTTVSEKARAYYKGDTKVLVIQNRSNILTASNSVSGIHTYGLYPTSTVFDGQTLLQNQTYQTNPYPLSLTIFASDAYSQPQNVRNFQWLNANNSYIKVMNLKYYKDNILCGDFVPYVLDHVPCMYDTVTSSYFYNKGTGEFIPGPSTTPDESHVSAYVQNGLCVLYDGIENAGTGIHDSEALFWYNHANGNNDGLMKSDTKWTKNSFQNSSNGKPCEIQDTGVRDLVATKTFTLEFLVKPSRTGTRECFFSNYNGTANSFGMEHNSGSYSNGVVRMYCGGTPDFYSTKTVLADETAFITITSTPSQHKIYKNSVLDVTNNTSWNPSVNSTKFVVGGEQNRDYMAFYGNYHLLHLYNRVLTDDEILSNYNIAAGKYLPPPVTKSFHFDGSTAGNVLSAVNYVTGSTYVDPMNKSWSIWAKCDTAPGGREFFKFSSVALGYGDTSNMNNIGNYLWTLYEVVAWKLKWQNTNMDTNWHHYCLTISSNGTPSMYYDGQLVATGSSSSFSNTATNYMIGGSSSTGSTRNFSGYLTRFCVFNKTLTAAEVLEDYNRRNLYPINTSTITYVNMDVENGLVKDHFGNYDLAILGTSTQTTDIPSA